MKSSILILLIVVFMLSGMPGYFCAADDGIDVLSDLKLLEQLEGQKLMENIRMYSREMQYQYNESARIGKLVKDFGVASDTKAKPAMAHEILYVLGYTHRGLRDNSLLYRDEVFTKYYNARTARVLEEYRKTGKVDLKSFISRSKKEFDIYFSELQKDSRKKSRAILLMQDKLIDKMYLDDMKNKSSYLDKILELRRASNLDKRNQSIYELMESRVRLKLIEELMDTNKNALKAYMDKTKVLVKSDSGGVLAFRYISDIGKRTIQDYSVYLTTGSSDYKLTLPLSRLAAIYGKVTFTDKSGNIKVMSRDSIWSNIHMVEGGFEINLAEAYISENELPGYDILSILPDNTESADINELLERGKSLETGSKEAERLAQEITKSFCALDSYYGLRVKGISNAYTSKFEADKGVWQAGINANLSRMNKLTAGLGEPDTSYIGFLSYIRRYADYSRECTKAGLPESGSILKFRDTVLQFRTVEEGTLWIIDMLYKMKYL